MYIYLLPIGSFPTDIRERFHYVVLMMLVSVRNLTQFKWDPSEYQHHGVVVTCIIHSLKGIKGCLHDMLHLPLPLL